MSYNKYLLLLLAVASLSADISAAKKKVRAKRTVSEHQFVVGEDGVLRKSEDDSEASFYGTNYTLPFAHAYRAMDYLGCDQRRAIDKDVYHFARLGFNAYRLHIWDVEISDEKGNVLDNEHLALLDYLIFRLKERNINVLLTAMTNFGNGYPERNVHTPGFTYLYNKCDIHSNAQAQKAQQNYIAQLVSHVNPYTGKAYKDEPLIVGFEINNEPCHTGEPDSTKAYIDGMLQALRSAGNSKPVFYNVSHNEDHRAAYFASDVQGTTYQWYPIGLVSGHTRKGNFLPAVDSYDIPFSDLEGFASKAKAVYEFDPADIMYSYMYPAMTRSFRSAGFQWITQFAYDPIDMAAYNTEYQTHYMNLAYTPSKALSMKVAAEVAFNTPRGASFEPYPADTLFFGAHVSYQSDLSEYLSREKFFYSNNTTSLPTYPHLLESVAGCGSSNVVSYSGSGAYFLDRLESGLWRLEVMPDVVELSDPFAKPSLKKEVRVIRWNTRKMHINLDNLGGEFTVQPLDKGNRFTAQASQGDFTIRPGVYLLRSAHHAPALAATADQSQWTASTRWKNIRLGEFVAPEPVASDKNAQAFAKGNYWFSHTPLKVINEEDELALEATIVSAQDPDSVIVFPSWVSFWNDENPSVTVRKVDDCHYRGYVPADWVRAGEFSYNIVVYAAGRAMTYPSALEGTPLDWDAPESAPQLRYSVRVEAPESALRLITSACDDSNIEVYALPFWPQINVTQQQNMPFSSNSRRYEFIPHDPKAPSYKSFRFFLRKYVKEEIDAHRNDLDSINAVCLRFSEIAGTDTLNVAFVTSWGYTYQAEVVCDENIKKGGEVCVSFEALHPVPTALLPIGYPSFLKSYFTPALPMGFSLKDVEQIEISTPYVSSPVVVNFVGCYLPY